MEAQRLHLVSQRPMIFEGPPPKFWRAESLPYVAPETAPAAKKPKTVPAVITHELYAKVVELTKAGKKRGSIAYELGITRAMIDKIRKEALPGFKFVRASKLKDSALIQRVEALLREGKTVREVCEATDLSTFSVRKIGRERVWPQRPAAAAAQSLQSVALTSGAAMTCRATADLSTGPRTAARAAVAAPAQVTQKSRYTPPAKLNKHRAMPRLTKLCQALAAMPWPLP